MALRAHHRNVVVEGSSNQQPGRRADLDNRLRTDAFGAQGRPGGLHNARRAAAKLRAVYTVLRPDSRRHAQQIDFTVLGRQDAASRRQRAARLLRSIGGHQDFHCILSSEFKLKQVRHQSAMNSFHGD